MLENSLFHLHQSWLAHESQCAIDKLDPMTVFDGLESPLNFKADQREYVASGRNSGIIPSVHPHNDWMPDWLLEAKKRGDKAQKLIKQFDSLKAQVTAYLTAVTTLTNNHEVYKSALAKYHAQIFEDACRQDRMYQITVNLAQATSALTRPLNKYKSKQKNRYPYGLKYSSPKAQKVYDLQLAKEKAQREIGRQAYRTKLTHPIYTPDYDTFLLAVDRVVAAVPQDAEFFVDIVTASGRLSSVKDKDLPSNKGTERDVYALSVGDYIAVLSSHLTHAMTRLRGNVRIGHHIVNTTKMRQFCKLSETASNIVLIGKDTIRITDPAFDFITPIDAGSADAALVLKVIK